MGFQQWEFDKLFEIAQSIDLSLNKIAVALETVAYRQPTDVDAYERALNDFKKILEKKNESEGVH